MFLHDIGFDKFDIACEDALTAPKHWDEEPFELLVCFPGIMYRSGAEQRNRKYLVDNNFIDCVVQLPGNLFFGTSIATCIMVLKKQGG